MAAARAGRGRAAPLGQETDARQVFRRLAGCWTYWGWKGGYFSTEADARAFFDETCYMLAAQMAAPNSPQWFNTGLHWAYGIEGPAAGPLPRRSGDRRDDRARPRPTSSPPRTPASSSRSTTTWSTKAASWTCGSARPASSNTARGTGSNFSALRGEGEPLSGGGKSSGLMSFLKIGDRAAGAIKSGGTTRRAAKMVVLDLDHPDIEEFVNWKVIEEQKVAALVTGSQAAQPPPERHPEGLPRLAPSRTTRFDRTQEHDLRKAIAEAHAALVPANYIERVLQLAKQGFTSLHIEEYDTDWNSKAYYTVSGQNSNNSVRIANAFMEAVAERRPLALSTGGPRRRRPQREGRPPKPRKTLQGPRAVGPDRLRRLVLRRSRRAVRHDHQRMAHLPGGRADQCVEPVLANTCSSTTPPAIWRR